ncbi:cytochrome c oxidase subunit IV family [Chytridium lagenaria]|nr:cytochrome c oxidase subunit IV family [Chytridium lagenaria]
MLRTAVRFAATQQRRTASTSVTPAAFAQLETRWAKLPEAEQGAIADKLAAAQKGDWKTLSLEEKRAAYFIAYGPYGARNPTDPALKYSVAAWTTGFVLLAAGLWRWWDSRKPTLITQTPEWKEAQKQIQIEGKENPFKGPAAAGLTQ